MTEQEYEVANYINLGPQRSRSMAGLKNEFIANRGWATGTLLKILGRLITDMPRAVTVSDEQRAENAIYTATNVMQPPEE
jgi:hypothetical protein